MDEKVVLFDFCETLVDFQTADAYVDYVRTVTGSKRMIGLETVQKVLRKYKVISVLEKLTPGQSINKKLKLYQLKGICQDRLVQYAEQYYHSCIKPHFITKILEKMIEYKNDGCKVGLVSGGYGIYLHFFVEEYKLDFCLSSNIKFKNGICTGKIDGIDCLNENKIKLLNRHYKEKPIYTIAYSDSISDLPMFKWVNKGIVISRGKSQEWSKQYNLEEIVW